MEKMTLTQAMEALIAEVRELPLTLDPDVTIYFDSPDRAIREAFMTGEEKTLHFLERLEDVYDESESLYRLAIAEIEIRERFALIVGVIRGLVMVGKSPDYIKSVVASYLVRFTDRKESEEAAPFKSVEKKNNPVARDRAIRKLVWQIVAPARTVEQIKASLFSQDQDNDPNFGDVCLLIDPEYNDLLEQRGGPSASGPKVEAARRRLEVIEEKLNFYVGAAVERASARIFSDKALPS